MPLEFASTDWQAWEEQEKNKTIEQIASSLPYDLFHTRRDRESLERIIRQTVEARSDLVASHEIDSIVSSILGQATGYGPLLEFFLPGAEDITEIFVNPSPDGPKVFYSSRGRPWAANKAYYQNNEEEVLKHLQKLCDDSGRPLTMSEPIQDAWLKDGTRIAAMAFGVTPFGPAATFRKSPVTRPPMPLEKLVEFGMLPEFAARLLVDLLVQGHANIGVFGRTDSGKTTFLRALGLHMDPMERVLIAETSFELYLPHLQNVVNMVEVSVGDKVIVDMGALVRTMNRNNPDRAIAGEVRGKELIAASRMAASTSGGFWTTGHAGDVNALRTALKGMYREAKIELSRQDLDEEVAAMFHFLVFLDKETMTDERKRTLMEIVEVSPGGYRTIIKFDTREFAASGGKTRRWTYENPVSPERLAMLAFRGARVRPEYGAVREKYIQ